MKSTASKTSNTALRPYGTGRRKESAARVWLSPGSGKVMINGRSLESYFSRLLLRMIVNQPFAITNTTGQYDVFCTVRGGGSSGQAGAIRHGVARALDKADPTLHSTLHAAGLRTRDSRTVERKKYGRKKARKRFQFSKR